MRVVSYAEDRADHRGRERAKPYVQVHPALGDRHDEDSECVQYMSFGGDDEVGDGCDEGVAERVGVADAVAMWRAL